MDTGGNLTGGKVGPERYADYYPHLVTMSRISRSYTSSPPGASMVRGGTANLFIQST
jgi:hypothetical protein